MSTRSSARNLFPPLDNPELTIRRRYHADPTLLNDFEMAAEGNGDLPSIKVNGVTDDALRLYLFPHSLTHHATTWLDRLPRNSINTFEQMAKMFLGKYFPPSMVTKLRNEITNFRQHTFYNGLTLRHRDTINAAAGGTFMKRCPEECYDLIENMTAHHNDWDTSAQRSESSSSITFSFDTEIAALKAEMAEINKNLMRVLQVNQQVKAVTPNCETCGGPHSFTDCPAIVGQTQNVYAAGAYQVQFGAFCDANGITHNFSAPRTPQSNGAVERKSWTLQEMTRTMLNEHSIPQNFWCNAVDTSTYILNRILIRPFLRKTSYELFKGKKPSLEHFKVFGCKCFILNTNDYLTKFDPKSTEGIFLRYSPNSKDYIILNKEIMRVEESLNVKFDKSPPPMLPPLEDDDVLECENVENQEKDLEIKKNEPLNK
uniref:Retrovirus-related Pol polyprotein from transposon TNT 1-94 n=1 Tax=Tanacetum cinerariifolium TaxID=118510 RepID=A0A6L2NRS8_TANCI|nr:retrovirus-related Pol polyprotein from transposon TNT 1-94 [Tanacetum cinerariifolium]